VAENPPTADKKISRRMTDCKRLFFWLRALDLNQSKVAGYLIRRLLVLIATPIKTLVATGLLPS